MLSVHRLHLLREIASRGSIAAAAEALFLTPSAISQQMATLEREVGAPVLERKGRSVRLTDAGRRLVGHAERVLAVLEEAEADVAAVSGGLAGPLRTCAFPSAARRLLVPALAELSARHSALEITMVDLEPDESLPALKSGELDVVVTHEYDHLPEPEDPGIERVPLLTEPMYLAMPASDPRAGGPVAMLDLRDDAWVVGRDNTAFLDVVVRVANEAGYEPRVSVHSNDYLVILEAVSAGLGVALITPLMIIGEYDGVTFTRLTDTTVHRRVVAAIRRGSSRRPAVSAALAELRETATRVRQSLHRAPGTLGLWRD
ncbi:MAG: LysR family transcriptional regulator [Coriobacteriia bacterium]